MKRISVNIALEIPDEKKITAAEVIHYLNLPPKGNRIFLNYRSLPIEKACDQAMQHGELLSYGAKLP